MYKAYSYGLIWLFFIVGLNACAMPQAPDNHRPLIISEMDGATPTATPFLPMVLPTRQAAQSPTPGQNTPHPHSIFPAPRYYPISTQLPDPVTLLPQPDGQINIILLGSDQRPGHRDYRTDSMILATINPDNGTIHLTSIPRDLYVYIPGWQMQRINTAMGYGHFEALSQTMQYNLGVTPHYYILINFSGFISIVDDLGGIHVNVEKPLSDRRGNELYSVPAGINHMDGETALWYVRSRETTNDIERLRRSQEVLTAIAHRLLSFEALTRATELYQTYNQYLQTNLSLKTVVNMLPMATRLADNQNIKRFVIGYEQTLEWTDPYSGAQVLLPRRAAIEELMRQALNSLE